MPKLSHISFDEYVTIQAAKYPSLYGSQSFKSAKLAILDHLLSTIGNGISFVDVLNNSFNHKTNKEILSQDNEYLFDGTPLYYIKKQHVPGQEHHKYLIHPKTGQEVFTLTMKEIKELGWDDDTKYYWYESRTKKNNETIWRPYPYFAKNYSILWNNKDELHQLPNDFLESFIEYYQITLDFFSTDKQYRHHYACPAPNDEKKWVTQINEWEKIFEQNTKDIDNLEQKYQKFSKDYGCVYNGNMKEFLQNKHNKEIKQNIDFINETISMLVNVLEHKNQATPKKNKIK